MVGGDHLDGPAGGVGDAAMASVYSEPAVRFLCLGNDLLADDALGFLIADEIRNLGRRDVDVVETTLSGFGLIDYLIDVPILVVVDCITGTDTPPGTVFLLGEGDFKTIPGSSPHYLGIFDALAAARGMSLPAPEQVRVIAVQAADCRTVGGEMDPRVRAAIPGVMAVVEEMLEG